MAIKNIVFDFGGVLTDWNPRYFYKDIFRDKSEMEFFLRDICSFDWIQKQDAGYPFTEASKELQIQFPKYRNQIDNSWVKGFSDSPSPYPPVFLERDSSTL
jgi:2-haloacid dehalogenase